MTLLLTGYAVERATVRQRKTGRPVRFELTEQTRQAIDDYIRLKGKRSGEFPFTGRRPGHGMTTRQYARLLSDWLTSVGLDPHVYETHSLRRTKATLTRALLVYLASDAAVAEVVENRMHAAGGRHVRDPTARF